MPWSNISKTDRSGFTDDETGQFALAEVHMSDLVHVLIAVLFVAIWVVSTLLLRRSGEGMRPTVKDWDGTF